MRYYLIAGERSGDLHGGNLIQQLLLEDPQAIFKGFGGDTMSARGMELTVHYRDLAFMGLAELLRNLGTIRKYIRLAKSDILTFKPDVVILIDYGGFNRRIAKFAKANGITVFYYIPPKVWAWYQSRALELKRNTDRIYVILPFEREFYRKFDMEVDYVGNPVLDAVKAFTPDVEFRTRYPFDPNKPLVALLPGSRKQELKTILPTMAEVVARYPEIQFGVATVSNLNPDLYKPLQGYANVTFVMEATYDLLHTATAAIVTSGTATLETALFKVPQVVVYRTSAISYFLARNLIQVPYISLVNLIAAREVVPELIQDRAEASLIASELQPLLGDTDRRKGMLAGYEEILQVLDTGSASANAARLMVARLVKFTQRPQS